MIRKISTFLSIIAILGLALGLTKTTAFAETLSTPSGVLLSGPDNEATYSTCDPSHLISVTAPEGVSVFYYFRQGSGLSATTLEQGYIPASGLSTLFPYSQLAPGLYTFGVTLHIKTGEELRLKWYVKCEEATPTATPTTPPPTATPTATPLPPTLTPTPKVGQGCTPGYWKNHLGSWAIAGYTPSMDFDTVFGVDNFNPNVSLGSAVNMGGGGKNALARHGVAALLSAAHPGVNYPYTVAQVISFVQAGNKAALEAGNELGCPLN